MVVYSLVFGEFVSSLEWERFGHHVFRCIFCILSNGMGVVSTSINIFLAPLVWDGHFLSSLAWVGFSQHMLRCIL